MVVYRPRSADVPLVRWSELAPRMAWAQGEHVTLVGPTGQGKTTLLKSLLPMRTYVAVIATKPVDASLDALRRQGYVLIREWPPKRDTERVLLWPKIDRITDLPNQAAVIRDALGAIYTSGSWCVALDEARYVAEQLGARDLLQLLWLQGRSNKVSIVAATQRPRFLPIEAFSQATHLFLWRSRDRYDLDRLAGLGTIPTATIRNTIANLPPHTCLYVNTRDDTLAITRPPR